MKVGLLFFDQTIFIRNNGLLISFCVKIGPVIRLSIKKDRPMSFQQYSKYNTDLNDTTQYINCNKSRQQNQIVNLSNHHIYLPPAPTIADEKPQEDSTLIEKSTVDCSNVDKRNECKC